MPIHYCAYSCLGNLNQNTYDVEISYQEKWLGWKGYEIKIGDQGLVQELLMTLKVLILMIHNSVPVQALGANFDFTTFSSK